MTIDNPRQLQLEFDVTDSKREQLRRARVQRICNTTPKLTTGARLFDERAYREATRIARQSNGE